MSDQYQIAFAKLRAVIREVHSQHADDLCWMPADVNRIFVAAGLPPQNLHVGDKAAMRRNCDRYIDVLSDGGPWMSYAELEAEIERLNQLVAFYQGEGRDEYPEETEWKLLASINRKSRTPEQTRRLRELADIISVRIERERNHVVKAREAAYWRDDDSPQAETTFGVHRE